MKMDSKQGLKLILKAIDNHNKENLYQKWLHDTARFEMSFEDYMKAHIPYRKSTQQEKEEILRKWGA